MTRRIPVATGRGMILAGLCLLAVVAGGAATMFDGFFAPGAEENDQSQAAPRARSRVALRDGLSVITLDAPLRQRAGIIIAAISPAPINESVFAYGSVLDAGTLTDLSNRNLEAQAQVQTAEAKLAVSRTAVERARVLYRERKTISQAQLESAEGTFGVDQAVLVAAQSRAAMLAASALQTWGSFLGQALIARSAPAMELIEQRSHLIRVTLPPGVALAPPPQAAGAMLAGGPAIPLRFLSPAPTTNPKLQGLSFFYTATADSGALPGMNLNVSLPIKVTEAGALVPEPAVVWLQGKAWIYLLTAPDTFTRREITIYRPGADRGYVVVDLPPNTQIVVRGAQILLSEEFRAQVPVED